MTAIENKCPNCGATLAISGLVLKCEYCNTTIGNTNAYVETTSVGKDNVQFKPLAKNDFHYGKYFGIGFIALIVSFVFAGVGETKDSNVILFSLLLLASLGFFIAGIFSAVYYLYTKASKS